MSFGQSFKISSINNELQNLISSLKHGNATPLNVNNGTLVLNPVTRTIGINKINPLYNLDVSGTAKFTTIVDISNSTGTSGQVLVSTGSGIAWSEGASSAQIDISNSNTNQNFFLTFVPDISGKNNIFVDNNALVFNPNSNRLGVGISSPSYNLDVSGNTYMSGQIIASNGIGLNGQVLTLNSMGKMEWKDISGSGGGTANSIAVNDISNNQNYYLTFVKDTSGGNNVYIDSNSFVINPGTNRIGLNNLNPSYNLDISTSDLSGMRIGRALYVDASNNIVTVSGRLQSTIILDSTNSTGNTNLFLKSTPSGLQWSSLGVTSSQWTSDSSGNVYFPSSQTDISKVGIGTITPTYKLDISNSDVSAMRVGRVLYADASNNIVTVSGRLQSTIILDSTNSSGNTNLFLKSTPSGLQWSSLGVTSSQWTSDTSGNVYFPSSQTDISKVGIGTITPTYKLDISNSDVSAMRVGRVLYADASNNIVTVSGRLQSTIILDSTNSSGNTNLFLKSTPSGLQWSSLGVTSSQWTSDTSGNVYFPSSQTDISKVGIGTITPTYKLDISNSDVSAMRVGRALLVDASNNIVTVSGRLQSTILLDSTNSTGNTNLFLKSTPSGLQWSSLGVTSSQWTSDTSGNVYFPSSQTDISKVGIGTITPNYKLDISNSDVSAMRVGRALLVDASNNIVTVSGRLQSTIILDSTNSSGNTNLFLKSTLSGLQWSSLGVTSSQWTSDSSGNVYFPSSQTDISKVGIGTITPTYKLDISNSDVSAMRVGRALLVDASNNIVTVSGRLQSTILLDSTNSTGNTNLFLKSTPSGLQWSSLGVTSSQWTSDSSGNVYFPSSQTDISKVGIGTITPNYKLDISNSDVSAMRVGRALLVDASNNIVTVSGRLQSTIILDSTNSTGNTNLFLKSTPSGLQWSSLGVTSSQWTSDISGNVYFPSSQTDISKVGIGTITPNYKLDISNSDVSAMRVGRALLVDASNNIVTVSGRLQSTVILDSANSTGNTNLYLRSTPSGLLWSSVSSVSSQWTSDTSGNVYFPSSQTDISKVGIGTITPNYKLDISNSDVSAMRVGRALLVDASNNIVTVSGRLQSTVFLDSANSTGNTNLYLRSTPSGLLWSSVSSVSSQWTSDTSGNVYFPSSQTDISKVGIGTITPNYKLDISNSDVSAMRVGRALLVDASNNIVTVSGRLQSTVFLDSANSTGNTNLFLKSTPSGLQWSSLGVTSSQWTSDSSGNVYFPSSQTDISKVGIGTITPTYKLDISNSDVSAMRVGRALLVDASNNIVTVSGRLQSTILLDSTNSSGNTNLFLKSTPSGLQWSSLGVTSSQWTSDSSGNVYFPSSQTDISNVGIGIISPTFKLDVSGETKIRTTNVRIGINAGESNQGTSSIAIGVQSGFQGQDVSSIAIGYGAAYFQQRSNAIAIGASAGATNQQSGAIAIGTFAGATGQKEFTVAIGENAGQSSQQGGAIAIGRACACNSQGSNAISIGSNASRNYQGSNAISIGFQAGDVSQGISAIAIGRQAGSNSQDVSAIAIGDLAGFTSQRSGAIAIGAGAGLSTQGRDAICIGTSAGRSLQGQNAIAIGNNAGNGTQGDRAIAIGYYAGNISQSANSIILNASGTDTSLNTSNSGLYVSPVRSSTSTSYPLVYDLSSKEIAYNSTANVETFSLSINTVTANTDVSLGLSYYFPFPTSGAGAAGPLNTLSAMSSSTSYSPLQYSFIAPSNCILKGGYGYFQVGSSDSVSPTDISATFSIARIVSDVSLSTFSPTLITDVSTGNFITSGASTTTSSRATRFIFPSTSSTIINAGDLVFLLGTISGSGVSKVNYPTITGTLLFRKS
jgi:ribosomal protein S5